MPKSAYRIIGLMSGTSLDGLDIAYCIFEQNGDTWDYSIKAAQTVKYNEVWSKRLATLHNLSAYELALANTEFGYLLAEEINRFIAAKKIGAVDLIASHGHTIFHQPEKNFTYQLGSGAAIAGRTGITTVCDFRTTDIALGGQGAPLVPMGDALLFPEYDYCLNIGGIANISFNAGKTGINYRAFDICPANMVLNELSKSIGKAYDEDGASAQSGNLNTQLLDELNNLGYYNTPGAKSLGREWVEATFFPVLNNFNIPVQDKLNTVCEHIAMQVTKHAGRKGSKMLVTGGGAYNKWLIQRLKHYCAAEIVIPANEIIEYKEALIFAFLGLLRFEQKNNSLASVTGASADNAGGAVYLGKC